MTTVTLRDYRNRPALAYELHRQARRERARSISRLFGQLLARVAEALAALRRPATMAARWG